MHTGRSEVAGGSLHKEGKKECNSPTWCEDQFFLFRKLISSDVDNVIIQIAGFKLVYGGQRRQTQMTADTNNMSIQWQRWIQVVIYV